MGDKHMQIGEVAARTELSLRTVRHHDETGLLTSSACFAEQPCGDRPEGLAIGRRTDPSPPHSPLGSATDSRTTATPPAGTVTDPTTGLPVRTFDLDEYVYGAMRGGACGFLLKDSGPVLLAEAVRAAAAGDSLVSPSVTVRLLKHLTTPPSDARDRARPPVPPQEQLASLFSRSPPTNATPSLGAKQQRPFAFVDADRTPGVRPGVVSSPIRHPGLLLSGRRSKRFMALMVSTVCPC
ncbi:hypothetical protein GCM10010234_11610 [Streptomyces hawaiiensis]